MSEVQDDARSSVATIEALVQRQADTSALDVAPDSLSPPAAVWTPNGRRTSARISRDQLLPSSPILRDGDRLSAPPANAGSTSRDSSVRLSKGIEDLRWDGSSIRDNDSIFRQSVGSQAPPRGPETPTRAAELDTDNELTGNQSDSQDGRSGYSVLSKRADFILENAKRKLNLLEGNLGRARHSLLIPPSGASEFKSLSPLSDRSITPISSDEEKTRVPLARINFAPPRDANKLPPSQRYLLGHSRVFSETSVPSSTGASTRGSKSVEHVQHRELLKQPSSEQKLGAEDGRDTPTLDTVQEDAEAGQNKVHRRDGSQAARDLRSQAEELRMRISLLQARSRDDSNKRKSFRMESPSNNRDFSDQVAALKDSLEEQQKVIDEIETQERRKGEVADPRVEWQQVLEQNDADDGDDDSYSDDSSGYDSGEEFHIAPEDLLVDEDETLEGAHEDRADAFDYEHFILHSVMGNRVRRDSEPSSTSLSTERANEEETEGEASDEPAVGGAGAAQRPELLPNDSTASLTTAESFVTANDDSEDDSEIDDSDDFDLEDADEPGAWPVPPSHQARTSLASNSTARAKPRASPAHTAKSSLSLSEAKRRPASLIVSQLTRPGSSTGPPATLSEQDKALMYSCAESFRTVCMSLQRNDLGPHDGADLRQRLEVAKRVLNGDL